MKTVEVVNSSFVERRTRFVRKLFRENSCINVQRGLFFSLLMASTPILAQNWTNLEYNSDQPGLEYNPLKGFTTLWNPSNNFPHSIRGHLFALDDLMMDMNTFDWSKIDSRLADNASNGVFSYIQVNIDPVIPGQLDMPDFLYPLVDTIHTPENVCPDWNDEDLIAAMLNFIEAYGIKYNNDPRVFLVHFGLYGMWGEWHVGQYGKQFEMTNENQSRLSDAYIEAFPDKQLLARYPTLPDNQIVGFSDGMFFGQSIGENSWYFHNRLKSGHADQNWKLHSIGGEIQPDLQSEIWDDWPNSVGQDVTACMDSIHPSWLICHHVLSNISNGTTEWDHAIRAQKMMGYTLFINKFRLSSKEGIPYVEFGIMNKGIAPMYADWDVELGVLNAEDQFHSLSKEKWKLKNILPGDMEYYRAITSDTALSDGLYTVLLRIVNPLEEISLSAKPVRFANTTQDVDRLGWISLGELDMTGGNYSEIPLRAEGISLDLDSARLSVGETLQLTASIDPIDASRKDLTWISDHPRTVQVDSSGMLTAGPVSGEAIISVFTQDGGKTARMKVNVEPLWQAIPGKIEAESYTSQSGIQTENTGDLGGGLNVGWIDDGDWMEYAINNSSDSIYFIASLRLSAPGNGGHIYLYLDETEIGEVFVPNTGSWQSWRSIDVNLKIEQGEHTFKILANSGGFNINYLEFEFGPEVDDYERQTSIKPNPANSIQVYPVPASGELTVHSSGFKFNELRIIDLHGKVVFHKRSDDQSLMNLSFDIRPGMYIMKFIGGDQAVSKRIIIRK